MHLALVSDQYPPYPMGGVGARVFDLATGMVQAGHRVTVAGVYPRNRGIQRVIDENINGVRVVRLPPASPWMRWRPGLLWDRWRLANWLRRAHRSDAFDLVEYTDGFGWPLFRAHRDLPVNVRIEGTVTLFDEVLGVRRDPFVPWMERAAFNKVDFLCALSAYAARETLRVCRMSRLCEVIFNAVDTNLFCPAEGTVREEGLIVFVNGIEHRKGVRELLLAMNLVCEKHAKARLLLIGSDTEPLVEGVSYSQSLLGLVRPEFRDRITFAGRLDRATGVLPALRRSHLCCYPSHIETFGVAPLEAMAVGKPVVYSRTGPGPELIEDGQSGLLCDPANPTDIAQKIQAIFQDDEFAARLGRGGRERAVRLFEKSGWIQRNVDYFQTCIARFRNRQGERATT